MYVLLITRPLREVGRLGRKPVNHTSWVAVVTPTDCPKSVSNRCVIENFGTVLCCHFAFLNFLLLYNGFCHRKESYLLLSRSISSGNSEHRQERESSFTQRRTNFRSLTIFRI